MTKLFSSVLFLVLLLSARDPAQAAEREIFSFKIRPSLVKLTKDPHPQHRGGVIREESPGGGVEELVTVKLDTDCFTREGVEHCSGHWSKTLEMDGVRFAYFANISNESGSAKHSIVLNVCLSGETPVQYCRRWFSTSVHFEGQAVPTLSTYNSSEWNDQPWDPASYQPALTIRAAN